MDAWVVGSYAGGVPGTSLTLDGDLAFIQRCAQVAEEGGGAKQECTQPASIALPKLTALTYSPHLQHRASVPSPQYGGVYTPYLNTPIVNLDAAESASDVTPAAIIAAIRARNRALASRDPRGALGRRWGVRAPRFGRRGSP